jgi:2-methylcitrate dehydratase PrpD
MVALQRGKVGLTEFDANLVRSAEMRDLVNRVTLQVDPVAEAAYPSRYPCTLEVRTNDGSRLTSSTEYALGDPENPMTRDHRLTKFRELAGTAWSEERIERVIHRVETLEAVSDVSEVVALLGSEPRSSVTAGRNADVVS